MAQRAPATRRPGRIIARLLAPLLLLGVGAAVFLIVSSPPGFLRNTGVGTHASPPPAHRRLPPYWKVRPGDSFAVIAAKTGLSVDQLQAYNPAIDPLALTPGERVNLWQHPPQPHRPKPKPPGPMFWTVRPGQSFGSIAHATGISIVLLQHLNPKLAPASVQPGDRVRLHR
ncbi:MAG TPA: LysM peptidoglycan-binding domain-containing protein [Solirubrobacteraceae bacterium]|nr:LysM peptidoglycan-binding domain-containing protein [Solirubrobacteraceae bacterium]